MEELLALLSQIIVSLKEIEYNTTWICEDIARKNRETAPLEEIRDLLRLVAQHLPELRTDSDGQLIVRELKL